jgi:hypothetical protein
LPIDGYLAIEEQFAKATTVFVARIERTEEAQMVAHGASETIVEGTFRTIEVLKGQPPKDRKVRSLVYTGSNCTIPLRWHYVFFLRSDNDSNLVWWPTGSFGTDNLGGSEPKSILEERRKLSASAK